MPLVLLLVRTVNSKQTLKFKFKQVLSFYFVFTVSSTVGFGDIFAMNTSERVTHNSVALVSCKMNVPKILIVRTLAWCSFKIRFLQIFCIFLFMAGASLFGIILSELNTILQNVSRESRELSDHLERYISFMAEYRYLGYSNLKDKLP